MEHHGNTSASTHCPSPGDDDYDQWVKGVCQGCACTLALVGWVLALTTLIMFIIKEK